MIETAITYNLQRKKNTRAHKIENNIDITNK